MTVTSGTSIRQTCNEALPGATVLTILAVVVKDQVIRLSLGRRKTKRGAGEALRPIFYAKSELTHPYLHIRL